jgi:mannan endo-1,4-beta-mannosidase
MKFRIFPIGPLFSLLFAACASLSPPHATDQYVRVDGDHFSLGGIPYYFAGTNLWYGCYIGSPGETGNRERLLRELDTLCAIGLTNLRILAASEESYLSRSVRPAIQRSPGDLNDSLLQGMDFLLDEMGKRHMRAVLYLNNYWQWSGGMAAYISWAEGGRGADPDNPAEGYRPFMAYAARFYSDHKADSLYHNYVKTIVSRRNSCNGRLYRDDPTILAWQLANEPRPGPGGEGDLEVFGRWLDAAAAYIHALDPHHLVSTGNEGSVTTGFRIKPYITVHSSKNIDYLTFHLWPKNWGWFDPARIDETLPTTEEKAISYINEHIAAARELDKPIVLEEFGMARDSGKCAPESPTTARDRYYTEVLDTLFASARSGGPVAGSNFWGWGGLAHRNSSDDTWRPGDPFLGDPPQEPQGYNSTFVSDTLTIRILREHAAKMAGLCVRQDTVALLLFRRNQP